MDGEDRTKAIVWDACVATVAIETKVTIIIVHILEEEKVCAVNTNAGNATIKVPTIILYEILSIVWISHLCSVWIGKINH